MQCTIRQLRHLECSSLLHEEPLKTDEHVGDMVTTSQVVNEPCCGVLDWLETLVVSERQVNQETVAMIQLAKDECRNEGVEDRRRYIATNASQLTQGGKAARHCLLHVGLHRQILIDENAEITDCCRWRNHFRAHQRTGGRSSVLTLRRGKPHELCLVGIQLKPIGHHPVCNSCQTSGNLLQQGADIRWTTCTINLSVVSVEVQQQVVLPYCWSTYRGPVASMAPFCSRFRAASLGFMVYSPTCQLANSVS